MNAQRVSPDLLHAVDTTRRRLAAVLFWRVALRLGSSWNLGWGVLVIILRAGFGWEGPPFLWGMAGLAVVWLILLLIELRHTIPFHQIVALLDQQTHAGGTLMGHAESADLPWPERPTKALRIAWDALPALSLFMGTLFFAGLSLAVPQRLVALGPPPPLQVQQQAGTLKETIALLREEGLLDPVRAEELQERLDHLVREATGDDPARTFEALDHLEDMAVNAARKGIEQALRDAQRAGRLGELVRGLQEASGVPDLPSRQEVARQMREAASDSLGLSSSQEQALRAWESGATDTLPLSAEQLERLRQFAEQQQVDFSEVADALRVPGRTLDPADLDELLKRAKPLQGRIRPTPASASDTANASPTDLLLVPVDSGQPGRGGSSRGGGSAPLNFSHQTDETDTSFADTVLPPAREQALTETQIVGITRSAPTVESVPPEPAGSGDLSGAQGEGAVSFGRRLLPRHQPAVQRYFERSSGQRPGG
jgi:hypothetical protein